MLTICSGKKVDEHFLLPPLDQQNFQDERRKARESLSSSEPGKDGSLECLSLSLSRVSAILELKVFCSKILGISLFLLRLVLQMNHILAPRRPSISLLRDRRGDAYIISAYGRKPGRGHSNTSTTRKQSLAGKDTAGCFWAQSDAEVI